MPQSRATKTEARRWSDNSKAGILLQKDFHRGKINPFSSAAAIYDSRKEYQNYDFDNFKSTLSRKKKKHFGLGKDNPAMPRKGKYTIYKYVCTLIISFLYFKLYMY